MMGERNRTKSRVCAIGAGMPRRSGSTGRLLPSPRMQGRLHGAHQVSIPVHQQEQGHANAGAREQGQRLLVAAPGRRVPATLGHSRFTFHILGALPYGWVGGGGGGACMHEHALLDGDWRGCVWSLA